MGKHIIRTLSALWLGLAVTLASVAWQAALARSDLQAAEEAHSRTNAAAGILPANAKPLGYSLQDMARATALFNTGPRTGTLPNTPFQILYIPATGAITFTVDPGTFFYIPLIYSDNSAPIVGDWPTDIEDPAQLATYWFSPSQIGLRFIEVVVDGKVAQVSPAHATGVRSVTTATGGTEYTVVAVFLRPLPPGEHTIVIRGFYSGQAAGESPFEFSYTVIVR